MKTEINSENKARFFALYWGQWVLATNFGVNGLLGIGEKTINHASKKSSLLLLKPLSQISDEDAVEVAKMLSFDTLWSITTKVYDSAIKAFYHKKHGICHLWNDLSFGGSYESQFEGNYIRLPLVYDYLRSRGYALPWMGISVEEQIEAGWVKLTEL